MDKLDIDELQKALDRRSRRKSKEEADKNAVESVKANTETKQGGEQHGLNFMMSCGSYLNKIEIGIKRMSDDVVIPEYKHDGDACCDIRAFRIVKLVNDMGVEIPVPEDFESITLYQGYSVRIGTGFKLDVPRGWCVNVEGRSGFSFDEGVIVTNAPGKCEFTYKGEYMVNLIKVSKKPTIIHKNDRIAQMEIVPQYKMEFSEVDEIMIEEGNERGENGLGSSGVK